MLVTCVEHVLVSQTCVGIIVVISSSDSFLSIVVLPALSRPSTSMRACLHKVMSFIACSEACLQPGLVTYLSLAFPKLPQQCQETLKAVVQATVSLPF
jgi:hypothetical protein